jgi:glycosyltransferase involved in cell wall biosynthesis
MSDYIIITPAHNEEAFIERTIESMISQIVRPSRWVVVNDASKDRTGEIVSQYVRRYDFIKLVNVDRKDGRNFGNKVAAFNRGLESIQDCHYEYLGNLDADISFSADYFANLLARFDSDLRLGVGGGMVHTYVNGEFVSQNVSPDSVAGAVQLFRRACFEQIEGYTALPYGGIDAAAEIAARMMGWNVRTFAELPVSEHRRTGTAIAGPLEARLKEGRRFHSLGYGFFFYSLRCAYRSLERPKIIGSVLAILGYLWSWIRREPIALSPEVARYLKAEQRGKLLRLLRPTRS